MSAREEVLAAVRRATAAVPAASVTVPRSYRDHPTDTGDGADRPDLLDRLTERVEDYRARVTRCVAADLGETVASLLHGIPSVVVPDGLGFEVPGATLDTGASAVALDAVGAVVTLAAVAIAETGTIVLDHGPGQGRRALTLVPDHHVCVVTADQVVPGVPDAVARLDPARPQTWISGPSATSDIELSRVEGVHGPRTLEVVLVG